MKYGTLVRIQTPEQSLEKFENLRKNGLESCQLVYKPEIYNIEDAKIIKEAAKRYQIEISAQFIGFQDGLCDWEMRYDFINAGIASPIHGGERIKYILSAVPFMKELDVTDMIIHAGHIPLDPFSQTYGRMVASIGLIAKRLKKEGMNLLFEIGPDSPVSILRIITEVGTGNLFVNLDTANIIMYGCGNPVDALTTFGKYVRNTHFKDGLPPTDPYKIGQEVTIGEGSVDFEKVIKKLKKLGYDRFITIERELEGDNTDILKAFEYIKNIWDNN